MAPVVALTSHVHHEGLRSVLPTLSARVHLISAVRRLRLQCPGPALPPCTSYPLHEGPHLGEYGPEGGVGQPRAHVRQAQAHGVGRQAVGGRTGGLRVGRPLTRVGAQRTARDGVERKRGKRVGCQWSQPW